MKTLNIHSIISPKKPSSTLSWEYHVGWHWQNPHIGTEIFQCFLKEVTEPGCQVICRWWGSSVALRWVRVCAVVSVPAPVGIHIGNHVCRSAQHLPYAYWSHSSKENSAALILTASTHSQEQCATHLSIVLALQKSSSVIRTQCPFLYCPRNRGWTIFIEL